MRTLPYNSVLLSVVPQNKLGLAVQRKTTGPTSRIKLKFSKISMIPSWTVWVLFSWPASTTVLVFVIRLKRSTTSCSALIECLMLLQYGALHGRSCLPWCLNDTHAIDQKCFVLATVSCNYPDAALGRWRLALSVTLWPQHIDRLEQIRHRMSRLENATWPQGWAKLQSYSCDDPITGTNDVKLNHI